MTLDPVRVKAARLREAMMAIATERGPDRAVDPMEVAVAIAGHDEKVWRRLMKPLKDEAARLARRGEIVVLRKGKPADPEKLRGLWRFRLKREGEVVVFEEKKAREEDADILEDDDDEDDF